MKTIKVFSGILATAFALSLAGADIAMARYGQCGQGQGGGRGVCLQTDQPQTCPNYQGQGRKKGQGRQQRLRDGSCVNNPGATPPTTATPTTPAPSN